MPAILSLSLKSIIGLLIGPLMVLFFIAFVVVFLVVVFLKTLVEAYLIPYLIKKKKRRYLRRLLKEKLISLNVFIYFLNKYFSNIPVEVGQDKFSLQFSLNATTSGQKDTFEDHQISQKDLPLFVIQLLLT